MLLCRAMLLYYAVRSENCLPTARARYLLSIVKPFTTGLEALSAPSARDPVNGVTIAEPSPLVSEYPWIFGGRLTNPISPRVHSLPLPVPFRFFEFNYLPFYRPVPPVCFWNRGGV